MRKTFVVLGLAALLPVASATHFTQSGSGTLDCSYILKVVSQLTDDCSTYSNGWGVSTVSSPEWGTFTLTVNWVPTDPNGAYNNLRVSLQLNTACVSGQSVCGGVNQCAGTILAQGTIAPGGSVSAGWHNPGGSCPTFVQGVSISLRPAASGLLGLWGAPGGFPDPPPQGVSFTVDQS